MFRPSRLWALSLSLLVASLPSCSRSSNGRAFVTVGNQTFVFDCDQLNTELAAGRLQVDFDEQELGELDLSRTNARISYDMPSGAPFEFELADNASIPLVDANYDFFLTDCEFAALEVTFRILLEGYTLADQPFSSSSNGSLRIRNEVVPASNVELLAEAVLGFDVENFNRFTLDVETGIPQCNSNPEVPARVPMDGFTESFMVGAFTADLSQGQLDAAFCGAEANFPEGQGPMAYRLTTGTTMPLEPGPYLFAWQCVRENVPLNGDQFLQYGYVADSDGNPLNNYQGEAPFEKDYFDDTDRWLAAQYSPTAGWDLNATLARSGSLSSYETAATVLIFNQVILWVVPFDDFESMDSIDGRVTAFSHTGGFGQNGDPWSGSLRPSVAEPKREYSLGLTYDF